MSGGAGLVIGALSVLLPAVARRSGLEPIGLAALAAAPFAANVLGALAGRVDLHTPRHLALVQAIGVGFLLAVPILPPAGWVPLVFGAWLGFSFGMPIQLRLWGLLYPARDRGRLVGLVRTARAAGITAVSAFGGVVADRIGGPTVVALAGGLAVLATVPYARLPQPARAVGAAVEPPRLSYSPREALAALLGHPRLRTLALAQGTWGAGTIAAAPLYPLVQVDRLQLSLAEIGALGILSSVATMTTYVGWGMLADRRGGGLVLLCGASLGLAVPVVYALTPALPPLWAAALLAGAASGAIDSGVTGALSEDVPVDERPRIMAAWNALTGARGAVAPFLASGFVQAGLLAPSVALLLCAAVSTGGLALYVTILRDQRRAARRGRPA